jgi:ATP/ADP translocase
MAMLYLPLPATVVRRVKTCVDVVLQRLGDGAAGLIVLFYALFMMPSDAALLGYFSLGLIIIWAMLIFVLRSGYLEALRTGLKAQALRWEGRHKKLTMPTSKPSKQYCEICGKK